MAVRFVCSLLACLFAAVFFAVQPAVAADVRLQVDVNAQEHDVEVRWLHSHVRKAADMALPVLWQRLVPAHSQNLIPKKVKAVRFLQKAKPTEEGVRITFHEKRVFTWLKNNQIPYYAEQSAEPVQPPAPVPAAQPTAPLQQMMTRTQAELILTVVRRASLPEQVLFEEDLKKDPRILSLSLRQVNRDSQQYRVQLKGADDAWLTAWFRRRGLTLTASVEGWVAR